MRNTYIFYVKHIFYFSYRVANENLQFLREIWNFFGHPENYLPLWDDWLLGRTGGRRRPLHFSHYIPDTSRDDEGG